MKYSDEFKDVLKNAKTVVVLTGAGVSKESGLDTFRDVGGFWGKYNPMELASPQGFLENPKLVLTWYSERKKKAKDATPNPGHIALAEMEILFDDFFLFTQNVDNLHKRAGSKNLYELHGNIFESKCFTCGEPYYEEYDVEKELPKCPFCGGLIRPNVVWFGESLQNYILDLAFEKSQNSDLFFTIGTSSEVYPAAQLPYLAKKQGAYVVEINPNNTSFTHLANIHFNEKSGEVLPEILEIIKKEKERL